jgi:hypothetical protein
VQEGRNAVLLDTVPYASNGSFAINLWMRRLPGSSYDGELHQYLYSHTGLEHATISGQVANKVWAQHSIALHSTAHRACQNGAWPGQICHNRPLRLKCTQHPEVAA